MKNVSHGNLRIFLNYFRALNTCFNFFIAVLESVYEINNKNEIETGVRLRQICSLNLKRLTVPMHLSCQYQLKSVLFNS